MKTFDAVEKIELLKSHQRKPPVDVHAIAEKFGIEVTEEDFSEHRISGKLKRLEKGKYKIQVNRDHYGLRQRYTVAHLLAHYVTHEYQLQPETTDDALYRSGFDVIREERVKRLATQILIPSNLLRKEFEKGNYDLENLAEIFKVPKSVISIRLGCPYEEAEKITGQNGVAPAYRTGSKFDSPTYDNPPFYVAQG